jgi:preprotein translocase subunit YajC
MITALESSLITGIVDPASGLVVAQAAGGQGSMISTLMMMGMIFVIFYFLLIRPQKKEHQAHMALLMGLQKGDKVATASGLHGRVYEVGGDTVVLEVADRVRLTVDKSAVKRKVDVQDASAAKGA